MSSIERTGRNERLLRTIAAFGVAAITFSNHPNIPQEHKGWDLDSGAIPGKLLSDLEEPRNRLSSYMKTKAHNKPL